MKSGVLCSNDYVCQSRMNTVDEKSSASLMSGTVCSRTLLMQLSASGEATEMCKHGNVFRVLIFPKVRHIH